MVGREELESIYVKLDHGVARHFSALYYAEQGLLRPCHKALLLAPAWHKQIRLN
jgi:hypothetical protein